MQVSGCLNRDTLVLRLNDALLEMRSSGVLTEDKSQVRRWRQECLSEQRGQV